MNACTIIAKNYVAQARVLARSFAAHHPDGRFWVLVIDDYEGYLDAAEEPFEILGPTDIGCEEFPDMAARYTVLELSTAVKPWLLRHLLADTKGPVTYLDPDIEVFAPLGRLDELARDHGLVLTPHNLVPLPDDGQRPGQVDIMIAGIYNLGYVTVAPREDVGALLDWWADRLLRDCRVDPARGYFVDQRWFDLAPGLVKDLCILREPEYNVAYWNISHRTLEPDGDGYRVLGRPLAFFHFSGFDPEQPNDLSLHQDRVRMSDQPALNRICREYARKTIAEGYRTARRWPYSFGDLPGGVPFDEVLRRLYLVGEERGEVRGSPLTAEGGAAFLEWLAAQQPGAPPGINRLLAHVYGTRADLRERFPDVGGQDRLRLLEWSRGEGAEDFPALGPLPALEAGDAARTSKGGTPADRAEVSAAGAAAAGATAPAGLGAPARPASEEFGVNVVGYFRSELGVGESARQIVNALDTRGLPVLPLHGDQVPLSRQQHPYTHLRVEDAGYPVNLLVMNADTTPEFAQSVGPQFFAGRYTIGWWAWEASRFRAEWRGAFEALDEVWTVSQFAADAIAPFATVPIRVMGNPVSVPPLVPLARSDLGLPGGFLFLFSFDYRSVFRRKNPLGAIEAFTRAFSPGEGASLAIKCINQDADPDNHERLLRAVEGRSDIVVIDRYVSPAEKDTLTALADCYVSLHRSEGFGYTMAEAMFLGKPVIATGYSGNLDFMNGENSLLVRHRLVPVGPFADPYLPDDEWAEPDLDDAADHMRRVFEDRELVARTSVRATESILRTHSPAAIGERMHRRLDQIRAGRQHWRAGLPDDTLVARGIVGRVARGPWNMQPDAGRAKALWRRGALRAIKPFVAYQQTLNADVAQSLEHLDAAAARARQTATRVDAAILAAVRRAEPQQRLAPIVEALSAKVDAQPASANPYETERAVYLAISELRRAHERVAAEPRDGETGELTPWELRAFSQNGEDGVLAEILRRVGAPSRSFVEFGVESGREGNCVYLADVAGWDGLFIEGDPAFYAALEQKYRANPRVRTLQALVTPENVEELFTTGEVLAEPDVLSIDVDGADWWIWRAIDRYRPRVVVIEYNSVLDPSLALVQPSDLGGWDGTDYFGASLGAVRALGETKGYRLVHCELSGANAFLVREDLVAGRFPASDEVTLRGGPNYFQRGYRHPRDLHDRRYLDAEEELSREPASNGTPASTGPRA